MKLSIGIAVGLVVLAVQIAGLAVWIATLYAGSDNVLEVALELRRQSTGRVADALTNRLIMGEKLTNTSARNFRFGVYQSPDRNDPRGAETNRTLDMMRMTLYANRDVTTLSWTDKRGNLFGMYNDAFLTFFGRWDSYINPATGQGVLVDMEVMPKDDPQEGQVQRVLYASEPYNSSEQVWYTVIDFSKHADDAWTPIYYMGVAAAEVSIMLSHSRLTRYPDGSLMGVVSIDMAMGFVSSMLKLDGAQDSFAFGFVVDVLTLNGTLIGVSDETTPLLTCANETADGQCLVAREFIQPVHSQNPRIRAVDAFVKQQSKAWDLLLPKTEAGIDSYHGSMGEGQDFISIAAVRRNLLEWRVVLLTPRSMILRTLDANVLRIVIVVVVCTLLQLAVCVWLGLAIRWSFLNIGDELRKLEVLDVERFNEAEPDDKTKSFFSEVSALQHSTHRLGYHLKQIKAYVPQSVKEQISGQEHDDDNRTDHEDASHTESKSVLGSERGPASASRGAQNGKATTASGQLGNDTRFSLAPRKVSSARSGQSMSDVAAISADHTAIALSVRNVTVLCVNVRKFYLQLATFSLAGAATHATELVADVLKVIASQRGVLDFFQGDRFIVTFNAVTLSPGHMQNAAICAHRLTSLHQHKISCGVASSRCLVGNVGTEAVRRFNIIGPAYTQAVTLERMTRLFAQGECRMLTTKQIAAAAGHHASYELLDIVRLPHLQQPVTLASVSGERDAGQHTDEWMYCETSSTLVAAFTAAAQGHRHLALSHAVAFMNAAERGGLPPASPSLPLPQTPMAPMDPPPAAAAAAATRTSGAGSADLIRLPSADLPSIYVTDNSWSSNAIVNAAYDEKSPTSPSQKSADFFDASGSSSRDPRVALLSSEEAAAEAYQRLVTFTGGSPLQRASIVGILALLDHAAKGVPAELYCNDLSGYYETAVALCAGSALPASGGSSSILRRQ